MHSSVSSFHFDSLVNSVLWFFYKPDFVLITLQTQRKVHAFQEELLECQFEAQPETFQRRHGVLHTGKQALITPSQHFLFANLSFFITWQQTQQCCFKNLVTSLAGIRAADSNCCGKLHLVHQSEW